MKGNIHFTELTSEHKAGLQRGQTADRKKPSKPIHENDRLSLGLAPSLPPAFPGERKNTSQPAQQLH